MSSVVDKVVTATMGDSKARQMEQYTLEASKDTPLTTYFGTQAAETDTALHTGPRGPTVLEDFRNREKVSHFDHERIPERAVHARGAGAFGRFKLHTPLKGFTTAKILTDTTKTTPAYVRFSTVGGSRGSADGVRDPRGFAARLCTDEGTGLGNNIPVFFIQDAIKFPDLIHAVKPEPHQCTDGDPATLGKCRFIVPKTLIRFPLWSFVSAVHVLFHSMTSQKHPLGKQARVMGK